MALLKNEGRLKEEAIYQKHLLLFFDTICGVINSDCTRNEALPKNKKSDCGTGQHQKCCRTLKLIMQMSCVDASSHASGKKKSDSLLPRLIHEEATFDFLSSNKYFDLSNVRKVI